MMIILITLIMAMGASMPLVAWDGPSYYEVKGRADAIAALEDLFVELDDIGAYAVVVSGYRSPERQAVLHAREPGWTMPAGLSQHQQGTAFDLAGAGANMYNKADPRNIRLWGVLKEVASKYGFEIPYDGTGDIPAEPWHINYIGIRRQHVLYHHGNCLVLRRK